MKKYYQFITATLVAVLAIAGSRSASADTVANRKLNFINDHYNTPYPSTNANSGDPELEYLGKAAWALSAYYVQSNLPSANTCIKALNLTNYLTMPDTGSYDTVVGEFAQPLLLRIALGKDSSGNRMTNNMGTPAYTNLQDIIWRTIHHRSKVADAGSSSNSVWGILGSENHNETWHTIFFLGAQFLKDCGGQYATGGARNLLADGNSLDDHYNAWLAYWMEFYRDRAREGLDMEVASPTYEKYTVQAIYTIMDLGGVSPNRFAMQTQAKNFLNLFWADAANEYCPVSTIRGGAGCRMYQDNHLTDNSVQSLIPFYFMNDWEDSDPGYNTHPTVLAAAMSSYVIPGTIAAIATNTTKAPYEYNSHRLAAGTNDSYSDDTFYHLTTPGNVRRDTWWTPEYVMGSATYDSTVTYTGDSAENHFCGVIFAKGATNRLIVQGIGAGKSGTADSEGVTSASNQETLVAALEKNAASIGMRVFLSNLLLTNLSTNNNWFFTWAANAYVGIRIATGGYSWSSTNNDGSPCTNDGKFLKLGDKWSPLVVQCGRAADYTTWANFTNAVLTTTYFNYDSVNGVMTYTNLLGQNFKMWRDSDNLPTVGPGPRSQNPSYTYKSPYIGVSTNGGNLSLVTNSFPGLTNVVLDFDYNLQ